MLDHFLKTLIPCALRSLSLALSLFPCITRADDWLVSRGDAASTGFAPGKLPAAPKLLWEKSLEKSGFEGTPVILEDMCFAADVEGHVYAFSLSDGKEIWKLDLKNGFVASLACRDGKLILGDYDGNVYCLQTFDGKILWQAEIGQAMAGGANFTANLNANQNATTNKSLVLISSEGGQLFAFHLDDGTKAWEYATGDQLRSAPTIWNNFALLGGCDGRLHKIDLKEGIAQGDGLPLDGPSGSTPALFNALAVVPTQAGMVLAYDLNTQEKRWSFSDSERAQEVRSSPAIANLPSQPLAIITTRNKRVLALDLSTGKMVWEAIVRKRCDASPVICDGRAWVGGLDGNLYAFDLKDGNNTWSYQLSGQLLASPAIANGKIVVVSDKGGLYCFGE